MPPKTVEISDVDMQTAITREINKAKQENQESLEITIKPGVYYGPLDINCRQLPVALLAEGSRFSSGEVIKGWVKEDNVWKTSYTPLPPEPDPGWRDPFGPWGLRKENLVLDGQQHIRPVKHLDDCKQIPFTHFADSQNRVLYVNLENLTSFQLELGKHETALKIKNSPYLQIIGGEFGCTANVSESGVKIIGNDEGTVKLDKMIVRFCNGQGIKISEGARWRLSNCKFNDNGWNGISSWHASNLAARNCEMHRNNWRGALGNIWGEGIGNKQHHARGHIWTNCSGNDNQAAPLWFDRDCKGVEVWGCTFDNNLHRGLMIEGSIGPFFIHHNVITNTRRQPEYTNAGALFVSAVQSAHILANELKDNEEIHIAVRRRKREGIPNYDDPTKPLTVLMNDIIIRNNVVNRSQKSPIGLLIDAWPYKKLEVSDNVGF